MWIVVSYGTEFNMIWLYHRKYRNLHSDWPYENNLGNPLIHAVRTITRYVSSCGTTLIIIIMCLMSFYKISDPSTEFPALSRFPVGVSSTLYIFITA